jgi:hypothetical protein
MRTPRALLLALGLLAVSATPALAAGFARVFQSPSHDIRCRVHAIPHHSWSIECGLMSTGQTLLVKGGFPAWVSQQQGSGWVYKMAQPTLTLPYGRPLFFFGTTCWSQSNGERRLHGSHGVFISRVSGYRSAVW